MAKIKTPFHEKPPAAWGMTDRQYNDTREFGKLLRRAYVTLRRTRPGNANYSLDSELYGEEFWFNAARKIAPVCTDPLKYVGFVFDWCQPFPWPNNLASEVSLQRFRERHGENAQLQEAEMAVHLAKSALEADLRHGLTDRQVMEQQAELCRQWGEFRRLSLAMGDVPNGPPPLQPKSPMNFLFCYCLCCQQGFTDLAGIFRPAAAAFLAACPQYRKTALGPFIPQELE